MKWIKVENIAKDEIKKKKYVSEILLTSREEDSA